MTTNSDPLYEQYANLDFADAKPVAEIPALAKLQAERAKTSAVTIDVDSAVLSMIKARAESTGTDYHLLINEALRRFVEGQTLAQVVRQTIREELHPER